MSPVIIGGMGTDAYRAVLEKRLPHVCREAFAGIARRVGRHYGVIDESREVRTHGRQVTAVRQPCTTAQMLSGCTRPPLTFKEHVNQSQRCGCKTDRVKRHVQP